MILGISDSHNASAALITPSGELKALQEERPSREKNFAGFPGASIGWLLQEAGVSPADLDEVALASYHRPPQRNREGMVQDYRRSHDLWPQLKRVLRHTPIYTLRSARTREVRLQEAEAVGLPRERITFREHHHCHAATAYYGWGELDEPVLVLTNDGAGDGICASVNIGRDGRLERLHSVEWSHSVAVLYAVVTYMMGMVPLEHEYKIMGMAPYAPDAASRRVADKLEGLFEWDASGLPLWRRRRGVPHMYYIKKRLQKLFFEERFDAIMAGTQLLTERMLVEFVRRAVRTTGIRRVALAGGIFMNVKANKEIAALDEVERLFVFPSCGDETNAIGACYLAQVERHGAQAVRPLQGFYLGPDWDGSEPVLRQALDEARGHASLEVLMPEDVNEAVADLLASGEVVARFSGPEEFGARSLGNRAILADPRNPDVIGTINRMVKNRDFWMPFAASVLAERADDYLENPKAIPAPYMILSFDTTSLGWEALRAGLHPYDRTCRPQVVRRQHNPGYWDLLRKFERRTGVGGVLNTSLNLHGMPLVHRPQDAMEVLLNSELQHLVLGDHVITKNAEALRTAQGATARHAAS